MSELISPLSAAPAARQAELEAEAEAEVRAAMAAGRACLTCSFQAEDMVVLDLARRVEAKIPVLFLETGYHFPETYAYRDRMTAQWGLNLVNLMPATTVATQEAELGRLYESDPSACCRRRKVEPLFAGLEAYEVWLTGLRREQSPTRRNLAVRESAAMPSGRSLMKVSPLAAWDNRAVWRYLEARGIEALPLYQRGYTSIGCAPCTQIPPDPDDPRSGRWGGAKRECGIHTFAPNSGKS